MLQSPEGLQEPSLSRGGSHPSSPGHTSCGRRPSPSGRAASIAGCIAPCALCWAHPSCWPSALRSTASSCSYQNHRVGKSVPVSDRVAQGSRPPHFQNLGRGPSTASSPSAHLPTHPPTPGQHSRRWLGGSPIKLVLELAFGLGEGGLGDALLTDVQLGVLLDIVTHNLLQSEVGGWRATGYGVSWGQEGGRAAGKGRQGAKLGVAVCLLCHTKSGALPCPSLRSHGGAEGHGKGRGRGKGPRRPLPQRRDGE